MHSFKGSRFIPVHQEIHSSSVIEILLINTHYIYNVHVVDAKTAILVLCLLERDH